MLEVAQHSDDTASTRMRDVDGYVAIDMAVVHAHTRVWQNKKSVDASNVESTLANAWK